VLAGEVRCNPVLEDLPAVSNSAPREKNIVVELLHAVENWREISSEKRGPFSGDPVHRIR